MMKKKLVFALFVSVLTCVACTSTKKQTEESAKPSKTELKSAIKIMEDSLIKMQNDPQKITQITNLMHQELINRLLAYYTHYPTDSYSETCLEKVHMKYTGLNIQEKAIQYGDTLLKRFPNAKNKALILESLGSAYDIMVEPRDTSKVRYYYTQILSMKAVKLSKKKEIQFRLEHLALTFDQLIELQMKGMPL
jgi:uncharacterized protein YcfL